MKEQMPYRISQLDSNNHRQWIVGKDNSETQMFYFDVPLDALHKLMMLRGREEIFRIINNHEELLNALKGAIANIKFCQRMSIVPNTTCEGWEDVVKQAEAGK